MDVNYGQTIVGWAAFNIRLNSHDMTVKDKNRMTPDLSSLPEGQRRAVQALIGAEQARTYPDAAEIAGISLGTMHTHFRRVRQNHPDLYQVIRRVRKVQLAVRHHSAIDNARAHTTAWFRRIRRNERYLLSGYWR